MNADFPYHTNNLGLTARADEEKHIRDMIEQVLFTSPGERVMRPTFGSGLLQLVFAPNSPELAAATRLLVQGALQQWLGHLIQIFTVEVESQDSSLFVSVDYAIRRTQQRQVAQFSREV